MIKEEKFVENQEKKPAKQDRNNRVYQMRLAAKLTRQDFSSMTCIQLDEIQKVESGKKQLHSIKLMSAYMFTKSLNCTYKDLVDIKEFNAVLDRIDTGMQTDTDRKYYDLFRKSKLTNLNVKQYETVSMVLEGRTIQEIAEIKDCSVLYILSILDYARAKLRNRPFWDIVLLSKFKALFRHADLDILSFNEQDIVFLLLNDMTPKEIALFYGICYGELSKIIWDAAIKVIADNSSKGITSDTYTSKYDLIFFTNSDLTALPRIYKCVVLMLLNGNTIPEIALIKGYSLHNVIALLCDAKNILSGRRRKISVDALVRHICFFETADLSILTDHQLSVVSLLLEGMTAEEIAAYLGWKLYRTRCVIQRAKEKILYYESNC